MLAFFNKHRYGLLDGEAGNPAPLSCPAWNTVAIPEEALAA